MRFWRCIKLNKNRNVYLMYLIVFLQGFVFYGPIAAIYRQARGLSMYNIFIIESISWTLMILLEIPWGWFADRFGYKKTIVISNFIFYLSKIVFYKAYSFGMFLSERILLSVALAGLSGCDMALLYSSIDGKESEKVFGRYSAFSTGGFLIASLLYTFIIGVSMDAASFLTIIPYGMAAILCLFLKDTPVNKESRPKLRSSILLVLKNKSIILLVLSVALAREVVQAITVFLNQVQYTRSGIDIKYFGILIAVVQLVRLCSAKSYQLSNRFGKYKSILSLYLMITTGCILLVFTKHPILSICCVMLISASMSLIEPMAMDIQNKAIHTKDRATILSIYSMLGSLSAAVLNPVIGGAADISIETAFKACIVICILACCLLVFSHKRHICKSF